MSDLATVKAAVKAWEKSFKAQNKRDPAKEDIKNDPGSIGQKYALYRRLSKQSQSRPSSSLPSTTSSSASMGSRGESSRSTPRVIPYNEYPTTPTPPTRKSSGSRVRQVSPTSSAHRPNNGVPEAGSKGMPNGTASSEPLRQAQAGPSSPLRMITPKKARPYSGPIHDPNPINPFAMTPTKTPSSASRTLFSRPPETAQASSSPFIHASSPRKFKQVLEANSLRKVREREEEVTPRTRARKRLRGEVVADTPVKDRPTRRRRGEGKPPADVNGHKPNQELETDGTAGKGKGRMELENLEDEFGPSPVRPELRGTFTELFEEQDEPMPPRANGRAEMRGKPSAMLGLFGKAASRTKLSKGKSAEVTRPDTSDSPPIRPQDKLEPRPDPLTDPPAEPISDEHLDLPPSPGPTSSSKPPILKTITFSDDEQDEWDPEGGHVKHRLIITGTRRSVQRARNSLSDEPSDADRSYEREADFMEDVEGGIDVPTPDLIENTTEGTSHNSLHPSSPASIAPPLLSLLSLQSPRKASTLTEMRYKAIFDPVEAARLRALRKGQDVYISGEGAEAEAEGEDWDVDDHQGVGVEGDDDWEEEPDGWKDPGIGTEEDW